MPVQRSDSSRAAAGVRGQLRRCGHRGGHALGGHEPGPRGGGSRRGDDGAHRHGAFRGARQGKGGVLGEDRISRRRQHGAGAHRRPASPRTRAKAADIVVVEPDPSARLRLLAEYGVRAFEVKGTRDNGRGRGRDPRGKAAQMREAASRAGRLWAMCSTCRSPPAFASTTCRAGWAGAGASSAMPNTLALVHAGITGCTRPRASATPIAPRRSTCSAPWAPPVV